MNRIVYSVCGTVLIVAVLATVVSLYSAKRRWDIIARMQDSKIVIKSQGVTDDE